MLIINDGDNVWLTINGLGQETIITNDLDMALVHPLGIDVMVNNTLTDLTELVKFYLEHKV